MFRKIILIGFLILIAAYSSSASEGWKSLENWRKLDNGLGKTAVRKILGEPERVEGGTFTNWRYPNDGHVVFYEGRLYSWEEPRY